MDGSEGIKVNGQNSYQPISKDKPKSSDILAKVNKLAGAKFGKRDVRLLERADGLGFYVMPKACRLSNIDGFYRSLYEVDANGRVEKRIVLQNPGVRQQRWGDKVSLASGSKIFVLRHKRGGIFEKVESERLRQSTSRMNRQFEALAERRLVSGFSEASKELVAKSREKSIILSIDGKAAYMTSHNEVNHGTFKVVFATHKVSLVNGGMKSKVALKFKKRRGSKDFREENEKLKLFKGHPNIAKPAKFVKVEGLKGRSTTLVVQHRYPMDLYDATIKGFPKESQLALALGMGRGLKAMHDQKLLHRDLKMDNVLLDTKDLKDLKPENIKLTDFGNACKVDEVEDPREGALGYRPPEGNRDERSDIYGYGQTLYVVVTFDMPKEWKSKDPDLDKALGGVDPKVAKVIKACIEPKPEDRLKSMDEVLKMLGE